jgi:hypothetical protein
MWGKGSTKNRKRYTLMCLQKTGTRTEKVMYVCRYAFFLFFLLRDENNKGAAGAKGYEHMGGQRE